MSLNHIKFKFNADRRGEIRVNVARFKLQKTQIKAIGGATGLFKFIDDHLSEKFAECWAYQIMDHAIDVMKVV